MAGGATEQSSDLPDLHRLEQRELRLACVEAANPVHRNRIAVRFDGR